MLKPFASRFPDPWTLPGPPTPLADATKFAAYFRSLRRTIARWPRPSGGLKNGVKIVSKFARFSSPTGNSSCFPWIYRAPASHSSQLATASARLRPFGRSHS